MLLLVSLHITPSYPSEQKHVLLSTHAPCMQGESQKTNRVMKSCYNYAQVSY